MAGYDDMTVAKLKEELAKRGLTVGGKPKKAELIARLEANDQDNGVEEPESAPASAADSEPASGGYADLTVAQLKAELSKRGLPTTGKKDQLIARLEENDGGAQAAEEEEEESQPVKAEVKKQKASGFKVGDKVEGLFPDDGNWYSAVIQRDNGDGTYLVAWTEDDNEYTLEAKDMKLKKSGSKELEFQAGDPIEGYFQEDGNWYAGRVKRVLESGSFIVVWDEDGKDYEIESKDLKKPTPLIPLHQLQAGQKFTGKVAKTLATVTLIDIGAERLGAMIGFGMYEGDTATFKEGDKVKAEYEEDGQEYAATIQKANKDGSFTLVWDEDSNEYKCKPEKMTLIRLAELEEGSQVEVYVDRVYKDFRANELRLALVMYEGKVGRRPPSKPVNLSAFKAVSSSQWLKGTVVRIEPFGAFVEVAPPSGGRPVQGLVHVSQIKDGFITNVEDEVQVGQEVDVCVKSVDEAGNRLKLSMVGC